MTGSDGPAPEDRDVWARWVLERRTGGDEAAHTRLLDLLGAVRDRVLERCVITDESTVVDVGAGDGLMGFGALQRASGCHVIFTDVSAELLGACEEVARDAGVAQRCRFTVCRAEDLAGIPDASVDVVTMRAVLMYVAEKQDAFSAFFRVLRPGGFLSLYEPVNRLAQELRGDTLWGYEPGDCGDLARRIDQFSRETLPAESPMMDFDAVDLFRLAGAAGFEPLDVELQITARQESFLGPLDWEHWLQVAPNPLMPSFGAVIGQVLDATERLRLEGYLRPLVESGAPQRIRRAGAYLWGRKPDA